MELVNKPSGQLTEREKEESVCRMKRNIYQNTIQEVKECFQEGYFHDIKEEVDDFLFALQH